MAQVGALTSGLATLPTMVQGLFGRTLGALIYAATTVVGGSIIGLCYAPRTLLYLVSPVPTTCGDPAHACSYHSMSADENSARSDRHRHPPAPTRRRLHQAARRRSQRCQDEKNSREIGAPRGGSYGGSQDGCCTHAGRGCGDDVCGPIEGVYADIHVGFCLPFASSPIQARLQGVPEPCEMFGR